MWKFCGEVQWTCKKCGHNEIAQIENFSVDCIDSSERQMGKETYMS